MRRNVLVIALAALCGVAMAAPYTYAAPGCGTMHDKTYAIALTGGEYFNETEPGVAQPVPNPIACVGVIEVGAATAPAKCAVTGELICNDNNVVTGPGTCDTSVLPPGVAYAPPLGITSPTVVNYSGIVPGLSGSTSDVSGSVGLNGAAIGQLQITSASTGISATFTIVDGAGSKNFVGHSNADDTGATSPPILAIVGNKQGTAVLAQPFPTTYGVAPYLGESTTLFTGPGDNASGGTGVYPGGFGVSAGTNQTNADGTGGGFTSFNNNNNQAVGAFPGPFPNDVCYDNVSLCSGPYTDGTVNVAATFSQPYTGVCTDANLAAGFTLSSALYGPKMNYQYVLVTADTAGVVAGGAYADPGLVALGNITPTASGKRKLPAKVVAAKLVNTRNPGPFPYPMTFLNNSGEDCIMSFALSDAATSSNTHPGPGDFATDCSISQAASAATDCGQNDGGDAAGVEDLYPGYNPLCSKSDTGALILTCPNRNATDGVITVTSPNCADLDGTIPVPN
jgi:hypothetical protein